MKHMDRLEKTVYIGGIVFLIIALLIAWSAISIKANQWVMDHRIIVVPWCQEDTILVGEGDYEHGTWDYYACIPADDLY